MPTTTTELVLVGGLILSLLGHVVAFLTSRSKVRVESVSVEAAADLARAQASGEVIEFLRTDYTRIRELYETALTEMASLRSEVASMSHQLAQFEAIVLTLPDEYRGRFAEVLSKRTARPKASSGGG